MKESHSLYRNSQSLSCPILGTTHSKVQGSVVFYVVLEGGIQAMMGWGFALSGRKGPSLPLTSHSLIQPISRLHASASTSVISGVAEGPWQIGRSKCYPLDRLR